MTKPVKLFLALLCLAFIVGFILNFAAYSLSSSELRFSQDQPTNVDFSKNIIYISGAIKNPGVYSVDPGTRLADLIRTAGGFDEDVDKEFIDTKLNLALSLADGDHIYIPFTNESLDANNKSSGQEPININTASLQELDLLPGIGPSTAQKIIDSRPFATVEELLEVKGIGSVTFDKLKGLVTVN